MDHLHSLRIFLAVAERESFAAGARAMGVSGPSATRAVGLLEERLGVRLFTRTTRQVRLTDVGTGFAEEVREILAQLQSAEDEAAGAAGRPTGRLRITCPQEFGHLHIAPIVAAFLEAYPEISVDVLMIDRIVNLVDEGYDIALRIGELPPSGLSAIRVGQLRNMVCAAPEYLARFGLPQAPRDLGEGHRIILTGSHRDWRFGADRQTVIRCPQHLIVSSVAGAIEIARRGWGLCRVLSYQVAEDLAQGRLQPVLEAYEPGPIPVHLVHPEGRRPSAKLRVFADFAVAHLRALPVLHGSV